MPLIQLRMFFSPQEVHFWGLKRPLSKIWHGHFCPSCIFGGPILVPIFSIEEFNSAKTDWLSALTGDRCVYVRVDVSGSTIRWYKLPLTLHTKWLEKSCIIQYVYICVYHKERGGSKCECLHLPLHACVRACVHVFLLLMSVCVCHGWASVQTKAPQRTVECVINLSDRQDLDGYTSLCSRPANPDAQTERILLGPRVWSLTCAQ